MSHTMKQGQNDLDAELERLAAMLMKPKMKQTKPRPGSVLEMYLDYHKDYTEQYGGKLLVLMNVGSFYEI